MSPTSPCSDGKGTIFVPQYTAANIIAFDVRTSNRTAILDPNSEPLRCSVDALTGNLAVANSRDGKGLGGDVVIYGKNQKTSTEYRDASIQHPFAVTPDGDGDLFISGRDGSGHFSLDEIVKGTKTLTPISASAITIDKPADLKWYGNELLIGDLRLGGSAFSGLYEVTVAKNVATLRGAISFNPVHKALGFSVHGRGSNARLFVADSSYGSGIVFSYPEGKFLTSFTGMNTPFGIVVTRPAGP